MSSTVVMGSAGMERMLHRPHENVRRVENTDEETKTNIGRDACHPTGEIETYLVRPRAGFPTSHGVHCGIRNARNGRRTAHRMITTTRLPGEAIDTYFHMYSTVWPCIYRRSELSSMDHAVDVSLSCSNFRAAFASAVPRLRFMIKPTSLLTTLGLPSRTAWASSCRASIASSHHFCNVSSLSVVERSSESLAMTLGKADVRCSKMCRNMVFPDVPTNDEFQD